MSSGLLRREKGVETARDPRYISSDDQPRVYAANYLPDPRLRIGPACVLIRNTPEAFDADGLSSDRIPAQDQLPDARRSAQPRAADPRALGANGSLSPVARGVDGARKVHPS